MHVYELDIPARKGLTNIELEKYASELKIPHFRGVYMKDTLPTRPPQKTECGIVNMNKMSQAGSHWVCYAKFPHSVSIYFDSFGQNVLEEVKRYLKTEREFKNNLPVTLITVYAKCVFINMYYVCPIKWPLSKCTVDIKISSFYVVYCLFNRSVFDTFLCFYQRCA